jgi:tetratricopeptide (TPR) repeat protein
MFNLPNRSQRGPGSPPGGNSRAWACRPAARVVAAAVLAHRALRLVRLALCLLLLDWAAGGSCGQDPNLPPVRPAGIGLPSLPAPASPQTVSTPGSNDAASLRSPALREAGLRFATTNLLNADAAQVSIQTQALEIDSFKAKLETAQRQRAAHLYEEATPNYVAVLSGEASDELKRTALLELALVAQEQSNLSRALQILSQYLTRWPQDANAPEILLRQGLIYRQLGSYNMALGKFYATMTTALVLKNEHFDFYRTLVLQAQAEIAETLALQNKHKEAAEAFGRLLKEPSPALNRARVQFRYIHSLATQGKQAEVVGQAQDFLAQHPTAAECAEVRFLLATGLKQLGRNNDALQEVLRLLQSQQGQARERPETLAYWQQRTGNEIANQLYQEGDFLRALDVYQSLLLLNPTPAWQCPVRYQIGLAYERLEQPAKAAESYATIIAQAQELGTNTPPSLKALLDMARWRQDFLSWQVKTEVAHRGIESTLVLRPAPTPPAPGPRRAPL